jgi:subtilisin family serine protease
MGSKRRSRARANDNGDSASNNGQNQNGGNGIVPTDLVQPGTTGRYLICFQEGALDAGIRSMSQGAGISVLRSAELGDDETVADALESSQAVMLDELSIAVVDVPPDQLQMLTSSSTDESGIMAIEPERVVYAIAEEVSDTATIPIDYFVGYRDAVNHVVDRMRGTNGVPAGIDPGRFMADLVEDELTWGLQITRVAESRYTGNGVNVAILDTGVDLGHPDFVGRTIVSKSFITGEDVQDLHGHGTHCIGTACGPRQPEQMPRYGIAYEANIYAGKVLSNRGSGSDGGILSGINWAIANRCRVISMSLGAATLPGQSFSRVFETAARRALAAGTLIVAAAGNESQRPGLVSPVSHPANCPSIMAVGALDSALGVARFSCGGINPQGGQVDIAGPGVNVRSSWPRPVRYRSISGTSMATPHVAGIAALHVEANNNEVFGGSLGWLLLQSARRLTLSSRDIGAGLVQAP